MCKKNYSSTNDIKEVKTSLSPSFSFLPKKVINYVRKLN